MRLVGEKLSVGRGGDPILRDLSLVVAAGEALAVTGPNGIGKSTLLRAVVGLLPLEGGRIALDPLPAGAETPGEACHYLGHRNGMKRDLTVRQNLAFWRDCMGGAAPVEEAARAVGLEALLHLPFGYLSAGQQRRIAIARLLLAHRPLWVLDEPTAGLDARSEATFAGLVDAHLAAGGLALMATHQPLGVTRLARLDLASMTAGGTAP